MASYPAVFELSSLNGVNGFEVHGQYIFSNVGQVVAGLGDVNGDGIGDFIVGSWRHRVNGGGQYGAAFIIYGQNVAGVGAFPSDFNLQDINGTNGFQLFGIASGDLLGQSVSSAGDVNGDGVNDILIGADSANRQPNQYNGLGSAYVIFGRNTAVDGNFPTTFSPAALDGTNGFAIPGYVAFSRVGLSVASAGDVNHDGIGDLIIGGGASGTNAGAAYVVFGKDTLTAGDFAASINLTGLDGTNGFTITGSSNEFIGRSVSSAGDINGDGVDDLLIGARIADPNGVYDAGSVFVVFGRNSQTGGVFGGTLALSGLDGTNGFRIDGLRDRSLTGSTVSAVGDINGDGFTDFALSAQQGGDGWVGQTFIVFGRDGATPYGPSLDLAALDGSNGFLITGAGSSVSSAGDFNGDGIGDLIVGSMSSNAAWIVFGRKTSVVGNFGGSVDLAALDGINGFKLNGESSNGRTGVSVAAGGDINGDGYDDVVIGASGRDGEEIGGAYVVFGHAPVATPIVRTAAPAGETLTGAEAADVLTGNIGKDTLYGLDGDDTLDGGDNNDLLIGGAGADIVRGGNGGDTIYGGDGVDDVDGGTGADKLYGDGGDDVIVGAMGNDYIYGGADNDSITGAEGNDMMDGGTGADAMAGGVGNDVYIVDDGGDTVTELFGEGSDIVRAFISFELGDNLETLQMQGTADLDGTGNAGANNLQGNSGANRLSGAAGVDTINGNDGDDIILGGQGNDLLRGGTGTDTFRVEHAFSGALETDQIYDFQTAEGDRMDFSDVFAGTLAKVSAFTHTAGEMTLTFASGQTTVRLDIDGNGVAEYQVKINGDVTADWSGWLL
ncbi:hypothetical protein [Caulobacter sp. NIBR1757]|uniref:hypothetical protein n=1 Tax=Caulobacter sp. NIBR1757 TaxID=3016000 RepID=UPI0022EFE994|nr:hypothetical protein [Caulobacter sp. NIBR1757]WGM39950.1 hypothetical protein AMEJIAPC_02890 [Caulobacter sp. NIBR1757]